MKNKNLLLSILLLLAVQWTMAQTGLQWQKNYGGSGNDRTASVKPTTDGGYIVAGSSSSNDVDVSGNHGGSDFWVAKLDAAGTITWQHSYGGSRDDVATSVVQTTDGGYIIAGYSSSTDGDVVDHAPTGVTESWIVKITSAGAISWTRNLHNITADGSNLYSDNWAYCIIQSADGGYVIGGQGSNFLYGVPWYPPVLVYRSAMLTKLNSAGAILWNRLYDGGLVVDFGDFGWTIKSVVEVANGYTMTGDGSTEVQAATDIYIQKVTFIGDVVWQTIAGNGTESNGQEIQKTSDGGYIVVGTASSGFGDFAGSGFHGAYDMCLLKITDVGHISWTRCFGGSDADRGASVQQTPDNSYLVAGYAYSDNGQVSGHSPGHSGDYWIVKVSSAGNFLWGKIFGGTATDGTASLQKTPDGGFIVVGSSNSADAGFISKGEDDCWLIKFQDCQTIPLPSAAASQGFCIGATVAALSVNQTTGAAIKWYNSAGTLLTPAALLATGNYFVSQTFGSCEGPKKLVAVTVSPKPLLPAASNQAFCSGATVANLVATGINLQWYGTASGGRPLQISAPLANGKYYVTQKPSGCESDRRGITVTVNPTPVIPVAPSPQNFCATATPRVSNLQATGEAGALIKWYNAVSGRIALASTTSLVTGNYYVTQTVANGCESSRRRVSVTVFPFCLAVHGGAVASSGQTALTGAASLYPNPASGTVTINVQKAGLSGNATIVLMDMFGKIVLQQNIPGVNGIFQKNININWLKAGVYTVKYFVGKESGEMKLVVTN